MKQHRWEVYLQFIALTETVGAVAGILTADGVARYQQLAKPPLTPPDAVFPIVWAILFALMGIGAARIWLAPKSEDRRRSLILFFLQLAANFLWSLFFFNLQAFGFSFLWLIGLWVLILLMILSYWRVDRAAALLQIPYLLWVTFAGYLNLMIWLLNR